MAVEVLTRFGTEKRHAVRQQVYDSMIPRHSVKGDDMEQIRIELGLLDLSDRQVADAIYALHYKHRLVNLHRPLIGRHARGWEIRKLGD